MEEIGVEIGSMKCLLHEDSNPLNVPQPRPLPSRSMNVPYNAVGDDAFPFTTYLMRSFPVSSLTSEQRIFNYRLSRMKRISENVPGIMAQKWRPLLRNVLVYTRESNHHSTSNYDTS